MGKQTAKTARNIYIIGGIVLLLGILAFFNQPFSITSFETQKQFSYGYSYGSSPIEIQRGKLFVANPPNLDECYLREGEVLSIDNLQSISSIKYGDVKCVYSQVTYDSKNLKFYDGETKPLNDCISTSYDVNGNVWWDSRTKQHILRSGDWQSSFVFKFNPECFMINDIIGSATPKIEDSNKASFSYVNTLQGMNGGIYSVFTNKLTGRVQDVTSGTQELSSSGVFDVEVNDKYLGKQEISVNPYYVLSVPQQSGEMLEYKVFLSPEMIFTRNVGGRISSTISSSEEIQILDGNGIETSKPSDLSLKIMLVGTLTALVIMAFFGLLWAKKKRLI